MLHELTIRDLSGDARDIQTLLFKTERGAAGYAARKGDFCAHLLYRIDGKLLRIETASPDEAEDPCGCKLFGKTIMYGPVEAEPFNAVEYHMTNLAAMMSAFSPRVPTNPATYGEAL